MNFKRSSGFHLPTPPTPHPAPQTPPAACVPYAAMGFIARASCGTLLRLNATSGRTTPITYKRRRTVQARA